MFVGNIHFVVLDYAYIFFVSVFSTFVLVLKLSNVCSQVHVSVSFCVHVRM